MRRKIVITMIAAAIAVAALPALAAGGAIHSSESWTDIPTSLFGPDECVDRFVTGQGVESGTATFVEPPSGGVHVRVDFTGSVDLYEATNLDPNDPQPGAFVGTWTYEGHVSDQAPPSFKGSATGVTSGTLALADGRVLRRQVSFHLTFDEEGLPAKVFFAKFVCSET